MPDARREGRVHADVRDGVGTIVFDNPSRRNAVSRDMARTVPALLAQMAGDERVRLLVVTGAGDVSFVSGADISDFDKQHADPQTGAAERAAALRMYSDIRNFPRPTLARIRGFCFGGGVAVAVACDLRVCSEGSWFSIPAARLGLAYRADFTRWLVEAVGSANAKDLLITARRCNAAEALRMGLVNRVIADATFDAELADYVAAIAANAPLSTAAAKQIVNAVAAGPTEAGLAACEELGRICAGSEDHAEGRLAFREKRPPRFTGR